MGDKVELPQVTILGRVIVFKRFNDTQLVLIHRMRQMLSGAMAQLPDPDTEPDAEREMTPQERRALDSGMDTTARFLDMLGFMVVSDDDREWLTMQMLAGNLELDEIARFVPELVGPDEKKKPAKKAVRAR